MMMTNTGKKVNFFPLHFLSTTESFLNVGFATTTTNAQNQKQTIEFCQTERKNEKKLLKQKLYEMKTGNSTPKYTAAITKKKKNLKRNREKQSQMVELKLILF